jgi:hypothetical protein
MHIVLAIGGEKKEKILKSKEELFSILSANNPISILESSYELLKKRIRRAPNARKHLAKIIF